MIKIHMEAHVPEYNAKAHFRAISERAQTDFRQCLKEFLRALIERVPVYSGMARASLLPLARELGVNIAIDPEAGSQFRWGRRKDGRPYIKRGKRPIYTISSGESKGAFTLNISDTRLELTINNKVLHYRINEFQDMRSKFPDIWGELKAELPWLSFEVGKAAYNRRFRELKQKKQPALKDFVRTVVIKV